MCDTPARSIPLSSVRSADQNPLSACVARLTGMRLGMTEITDTAFSVVFYVAVVFFAVMFGSLAWKQTRWAWRTTGAYEHRWRSFLRLVRLTNNSDESTDFPGHGFPNPPARPTTRLERWMVIGMFACGVAAFGCVGLVMLAAALGIG